MNLFGKALLVSAIAAALAAVPAAARPMPLLKATVPFEFYVANELMPAGAYTVERHGMPNMVVVRNAVTRQTVLVLSTPTAPGNGKGELIFRNQGGRKVLVEVRGSREESGNLLAVH